MCGGGEFHPLTPARIFDSRPATVINDVQPPGAKPLGAPAPDTFDIGLLGLGGVPASAADVLAVVVNITVTEPGANGYLEAYGKGAQPAVRTSIINFAPNQTVPNVAIVRPGADGQLTIGLFGQSGTAQVVVDVFGWFSTSNPTDLAGTGGARLIPTTPSRVLDTRDGTGQPGAGPLTPGEAIDLQIRGVDGVNPTTADVVPDSPTVTGVLLNVVGITARAGRCLDVSLGRPGSRAGWSEPDNVQRQPGPQRDQGQPGVRSGRCRRQGAHLQLPRVHRRRCRRGRVTCRTARIRATRAGRVVPLDVTIPHLRHPRPAVRWRGPRAGTGRGLELRRVRQLRGHRTGFGRQPTRGHRQPHGGGAEAPVPVAVPASSFLTAYPADATRPLSSNLNTVEGPPIPNMAVLKYGANNTVRVYNLAGYEHYLFDASAVILAD